VALTWCRDEGAARRVGDGVREGGGVCEAVQLTLGEGAGAARAVEQVRDRIGNIDILVNNAGIWNVAADDLIDLADEDMARMLDTNLIGTMQVTRAAAAQMIEKKWGRIISIGSTAGVRGEAGHSHYAASKGALLAWSRSLTAELAPHGITSNVVSPGWVRTDMTEDVLQGDVLDSIETSIPTGRVSRPDDIAAAVTFLASEEAAQISGVNLDVNGGAVFS